MIGNLSLRVAGISLDTVKNLSSNNRDRIVLAKLKIKEIAYIHADALAGGELKHHTLALIEPGVPCIALVPNDDTKDDIINNIMQIKARGGEIIGIASEHLELFDYYIPIPKAHLEPILMIPVLQLISYYLSVIRGNDPDFPRNLAKSVTVL